jgi:hypothetical protein
MKKALVAVMLGSLLTCSLSAAQKDPRLELMGDMRTMLDAM